MSNWVLYLFSFLTIKGAGVCKLHVAQDLIYLFLAAFLGILAFKGEFYWLLSKPRQTLHEGNLISISKQVDLVFEYQEFSPR